MTESDSIVVAEENGSREVPLRTYRLRHRLVHRPDIRYLVPSEARRRFAVDAASNAEDRRPLYLLMTRPESTTLHYRVNESRVMLRTKTRSRLFSTKYAEMFRARGLPDFDAVLVHTDNDVPAGESNVAVAACSLSSAVHLRAFCEELSRVYDVLNWAPMPDQINTVFRQINTFKPCDAIFLSAHGEDEVELFVTKARFQIKALLGLRQQPQRPLRSRTMGDTYPASFFLPNGDGDVVKIGEFNVPTSYDTIRARLLKPKPSWLAAQIEFDDWSREEFLGAVSYAVTNISVSTVYDSPVGHNIVKLSAFGV